MGNDPGDCVYAVAFEHVRGVGLVMRPDPKAPLLHALVEPAHPLELRAYEVALEKLGPIGVRSGHERAPRRLS